MCYMNEKDLLQDDKSSEHDTPPYHSIAVQRINMERDADAKHLKEVAITYYKTEKIWADECNSDRKVRKEKAMEKGRQFYDEVKGDFLASYLMSTSRTEAIDRSAQQEVYPNRL